MTQEATQAVGAQRPLAGVVARVRASEAVRMAWRAFAWSRLAILFVAVFAALSAGTVAERNANRYDLPAVTAPLGGFGDIVATPLARWDAVWYLSIAGDGYGSADSPRHAFFPLYPLLARGLGELGGGGSAAVLIAAYAVSLAAFLAALVLLYRLTALELGRRAAWPALLLLCVFPASLYFGAPYSESLFLLCSVGAFYAARTGSWAWAGVAVAGASATRSAGILLLLPLAFLYLYGPRGDAPAPAPAGRRLSGVLGSLAPRHRLRPDFLWLALAPAGLVAYAAYLGLTYGDPLSFSHVQEFWNRTFAGPLVGAWDGAGAAYDGVRQLLSGSRDVAYFEQSAGDPFRVAAQNIALFGFLCFAVAGAVGVLRRLPFAYGLYVVTALMLPLSYPVAAQPLMSLPRFVAVLFPIFMWLGLVCEERRMTDRVAIASAVVLGLFVTQFATWQWVA
ncbi:MAG TPA: mannosyltransferase family protein [Thermoleophilaceae bacterium]|nr:mannosyltransferase family protein [Thermoleophilaceae bacterium]